MRRRRQDWAEQRVIEIELAGTDNLVRAVAGGSDPREIGTLRAGGQSRCRQVQSVGADAAGDFFVVVDDDTPPERMSWRGKYEARKTYHRAVDIVACRASVFERKRGVVGSLSHTADQEGVVVYERH